MSFEFVGGPFTYTHFTLDLSLLVSKKRNHLKSVCQTVIPGSPMARRTKHEIKSAQKLARYTLNQVGFAEVTCNELWHIVNNSMLLPDTLTY